MKSIKISKSYILITGIMLIILVPTFNGVLAQYSIDTITFTGLQKTRSEYLSERITSRKGLLTVSQLADDVRRLVNLPQVYDAQARIDSSNGENRLIFEIKESATFFPSLYFGLIRDNVWFQFALEESNFLGLGHKLYLAYRNIDSRHNLDLSYRAQYLPESRYGLSIGLSKYSSIEPLYFTDQQVFFDYVNWSIKGSAIYNLENRHFFEIGLNSFVEDYKKSSRHSHEMTPGPQLLRETKLLASLVHSISKVDYNSYFLNGWDSRNTVQIVRNLTGDNWFKIAISESRIYKTVGEKGNIAARLRLGLSDNTASPFAPFVLDSYFNIRGVGNRIDRGTATVTLNLEYRQTVIDYRWLAIQLVGFSDLGTWRTPGGTFEDFVDKEVVRHFIGGGLRFIYKYAFDRMLRIDYGQDVFDSSQKGWVIGVGQYF